MLPVPYVLSNTPCVPITFLTAGLPARHDGIQQIIQTLNLIPPGNPADRTR
jgi:hypothetical protein